MWFWLLLVVIAVIALLLGVVIGAYSGDIRESLVLAGLLPVLAYAGVIAWQFVWQAGCPHCRVSTEDTRRMVFQASVILYGMWLSGALLALGAGALLGRALRDRRRTA
ncbi:MAG: hypothetical protein ACYDEB_11195 [Dehalococcoidia bacterium]